MYNINLVRYALTNQCGDSVIYKTRKIIEHYLEVIQDGELLYRFNDKEEACGHLTELIIIKSVNDVPSLGNNDRDLIKLVLENKTLFDENSNALGDIKEKAKTFKYTVFEFESIEDYIPVPVKNKGQNEFSVRKSEILLIEKNDGKECLKDKISQKYQVISVPSVNAAFEILKKEAVSVIILDIDISVFEGTEFIKKVRNDSDFHKIPVIVVTSSFDKSVEESCLDLGVSDFFTRPISSKLLNLKLANIIQMTEISVALNELEYDDLTGLYTRQAFIRRAREYIDSDISKEYAILGVDFENFKFTNEQYGEEKCNEFLAYIGKSLLEKITAGFAGRFAGDQFVMVFDYVEYIDLEYIQNFAK